MEKLAANFKIRNWYESDVAPASFLESFRSSNELYPLVQAVEKMKPSAHAESKVTEVVRKVLTAASLWSTDAKMPLRNGIDAKNLRSQDIIDCQNSTNLSIVSKVPGLPPEHKAFIEATLANRTAVLIVDGPIELDLSNQPGLTDLPPKLDKVNITSLNLSGNPLFHVSATICKHAEIKILNLSRTQLNTFDLAPPASLVQLNISDNPDLKNIDSIKNAANLLKLNISNTGVTSLPNEIWEKKILVVMSYDMKKNFKFVESNENVKFQYPASPFRRWLGNKIIAFGACLAAFGVCALIVGRIIKIFEGWNKAVRN